jgi:thioesterase domain-containing protein
VRELAFTIRESGALDSPCFAVKLSDEGTAAPFFLIDTLGGSVLRYKRLASRLTDQPVYALRQITDFPVGTSPISLEVMASRYVDAILAQQPEGPYYIGGYSAGGVMALEVARQIEQNGQAVAMLALLDSSIEPKIQMLVKSRQIARAYRRVRGIVAFNIHSASKTGLAEYTYLNARAQARGVRDSLLKLKASVTNLVAATPPRVDPDACYRAALKTYKPSPIKAHIVLYRTQEADLYNGGLAHAWSKLTSGGLEVHDLTGNHFDILREPHLTKLAGDLAIALRCARQRAAAELKIAAKTASFFQAMPLSARARTESPPEKTQLVLENAAHSGFGD